MHPPGASPPTCFALCSSLFHDVPQTHNGHGAIRRPASVPLPRRPVSVTCSFLIVVARNRRPNTSHAVIKKDSTESLGILLTVLNVFPAKAGTHKTLMPPVLLV